MRDDATLPFTDARGSPTDGWLGTRELPGYRAGRVVAKLDDLPAIDPDHLYFDLLLLDATVNLFSPIQATATWPTEFAVIRR